MADLMKMFGYNEKLAEEGVKMVIGENPDTEYAIVCRHGNKKYSQVLTDIMQVNGQRLKYLEKADPDAWSKLNLDLLCEAQAKTIFVKLGPGITFNGKKVPDTWQARRDILKAPTDFRTQVIEFSMNNDNYPMELDIEEVKKS